VQLLGGAGENPAELADRTGRFLVAGEVGQGEVAAGCQGSQVLPHQPRRVAVVGHEVHHRSHQQAGRLAEVDQGPQLRVGQQALRVAQVAQDHLDPGGAVQQLPGLRPHHRVVVHVHDTARRLDGPDHVVGVAHGRQAGADVDELADPAPGDPPGRPLMEAAVGPGTILDLRYQGHDPLGGVTVGLEVAFAA
jgi:hypothetical protein